MGSSIVINPFSKTFETLEIKLTSSEMLLIIFEGQEEYKKAAHPNDFLSGSITNMFLEGQNCLIRDTLFMVKRNNPLALFFILRKKGS